MDGPPRRGDGPGDEVQLFLAIGRRAGVRPADLVGALAGDTGIPGNRIGRISIFENKSFIGLSRDDAHRVMAIARSVNVRGQDTRMSLANEGPGPEPRVDRVDGHAKFGSKKRNKLPRKPKRG